MLKNIKQAKQLSKEFKIPIEDILLISLNCCGVNTNLPFKRIRFRLALKSKPYDEVYLGLPVHYDSPFRLLPSAFPDEYRLFFDNYEIGKVREIENDTCDATYFRRNKTYLTLNSNSRSKCRGCAFCGNVNLDPNDNYDLTTEEKLRNYLKEFLHNHKLSDFSHLVGVGICTGCFRDEEETLNHILLVRKVFREFGFNNEIIYIGSQITKNRSLRILKQSASPFSLYLTLECFRRRKILLKPLKAKITLQKAREIIKRAIDTGFNSTFLYILGLDPLEVVVKEIERFANIVSRFPIINLFQPYVEWQKKLRDPFASSIEYYLQIRKELEEIFVDKPFRPRPWENYRSLWYFKFGEEEIRDIRI
jgi:hypothetical protein